MNYREIMLVDDDEDDGEIFTAALGFIEGSVNCTVFHNASDALEKLVKNEISPDLVFLDLNMPVMNGQQFLLEIKKDPSLSQIPVIIFSTTTHTPTIELVKELGARDFITKPNDFDELVTILSGYLNKEPD